MSHVRFARWAAALAALLAISPPAAFAKGAHGPKGGPAEQAAAADAQDDLGPVPDAHIDVAKVRGQVPDAPKPDAPGKPDTTGKPDATPAPAAGKTRSAARGKVAPIDAASKQLDMRILLVSADGSEPTFAWWKDELTREGVPFDTLVASRTADITPATLQVDATHGRYQAIVLATGSLGYTPDGGTTWLSAFSPAEWTVLQSYEAAFGVRELDAYVYPGATFGLATPSPTWGGAMGGTTGALTSAGGSAFSDLAGQVPVDNGTWGYQSAPLTGFTPLVSGPNGSALVGTYTRPLDGVQEMVSTVDGNQYTLQSLLLFHGMLNWVTNGTYLGYHRNYLDIDVDDVFLGNDRWSTTSHANYADASVPPLAVDTVPVDASSATSSTIRMTPADVTRAVQWEQQTGVSLNMLFNGGGADRTGSKKAPSDPLTQSLLQNKDKFRWTSHTMDHLDLNAADQTTIESQIANNIAFAKRNGLKIDPTELVTGGHTGLLNPAMPQSLTDTGIKWIGADASVTADPKALGPATTVPRHPTEVYYNVATQTEQLDEYNTMYASQIGTSTWDTYVGNEATIILRHLLDNDARPHFVHQSNLAEDGVMYTVFNEVLRRYNAYVKPNLVQPGEKDAGTAMTQQAAWAQALAAGQVSGTLTPNGVVIHSSAALNVPVTGTGVGDNYGGTRSGWKQVPAGDTTVR